MAHAVYNVFLPIQSTLRSDTAPDVDSAWLTARGINDEALAVLRHIRHDVLPLIRDLEKMLLNSFSMFVHDRASGVPCPPEDTTAYIHLRLTFVSNVSTVLRDWLPEKWVYLTPLDISDEAVETHKIIDSQAAWYLDLIEKNNTLSDLDLFKCVMQHLHYFANMAQARIS